MSNTPRKIISGRGNIETLVHTFLEKKFKNVFIKVLKILHNQIIIYKYGK